MTEIAGRYRRIADTFTARVIGVRDDAWDAPAPCEGWVARDVVTHLVDWVPAMVMDGAHIPRPAFPDDPVGAWTALDGALTALLADPDLASRPIGERTAAEAVDRFVTPDILIHTWDLARATGQDETLDPDEVHRLYERMLPHDEALRRSGHYGPAVEVPDHADEQTKLIAFTGRRP